LGGGLVQPERCCQGRSWCSDEQSGRPAQKDVVRGVNDNILPAGKTGPVIGTRASKAGLLHQTGNSVQTIVLHNGSKTALLSCVCIFSLFLLNNNPMKLRKI
jgi:hypothetical protein